MEASEVDDALKLAMERKQRIARVKEIKATAMYQKSDEMEAARVAYEHSQSEFYEIGMRFEREVDQVISWLNAQKTTICI